MTNIAHEITDDDDTVRISFRLTKAERAALKVKAAQADLTISQILRQAVREFCED